MPLIRVLEQLNLFFIFPDCCVSCERRPRPQKNEKMRSLKGFQFFSRKAIYTYSLNFLVPVDL